MYFPAVSVGVITEVRGTLDEVRYQGPGYSPEYPPDQPSCTVFAAVNVFVLIHHLFISERDVLGPFRPSSSRHQTPGAVRARRHRVAQSVASGRLTVLTRCEVLVYILQGGLDRQRVTLFSSDTPMGNYWHRCAMLDKQGSDRTPAPFRARHVAQNRKFAKGATVRHLLAGAILGRTSANP